MIDKPMPIDEREKETKDRMRELLQIAMQEETIPEILIGTRVSGPQMGTPQIIAPGIDRKALILIFAALIAGVADGMTGN